MKKQTLSTEYLQSLKPLAQSELGQIFLTKEGEIVKLLSPFVLNIYYNIINVNLEAKLLNKDKCFISEEVVKPNTIFYSKKGLAVGFKMRPAVGINYNEFTKKLTRQEDTNLIMFNNIHKTLEEIVRKNKDIVFPDICTIDNIFIGPNGKIELIDYDGMQIGKYKAIEMSTTLDEETNNYYVAKYWQKEIFTKNLDIKSLILLYFLKVFNVDLNQVGTISPFTNTPITLDETFFIIGLRDYEIMDKVSKIFNDNVDNVYLEDTYDKLSRDYNLEINPISPTQYLKRLVRKK